MKILPSLGFIVWFAAGVLTFSGAQAAVVTLNASDASGSSSFSTAGNWSNSQAPSAAHTYVVPLGRTLRTPSSNTSPTFAGSSLTVQGGLLVKNSGSGNTNTINNLIMDGGTINASAAASATQLITTNLAGNINLLSTGGTINSVFASATTANEGLTVTANVSGAGTLTITNTNTTTSGVTYLFTATLSGTNTYSGGTVITGNQVGAVTGFNTRVVVNSTLGTGAVTLNGAALAGTTTQLQLNNANAIHDAATLSLGSGVNSNWSMVLNFAGTETIGGLFYNGALQAPGTYGGVGSGAGNILAGFSGTGILSVVPEPSGAVLVLMGMAVSFISRRRPLLRPADAI